MIENTGVMTLPWLRGKYELGQGSAVISVPVKNVEIGGSIQIHLVMSECEEYVQGSHRRAQVVQWTGREL